MIGLGEREPGQWRPQVVKTVASRGEGVDAVVAAIAKHRTWLEEHGELQRRREGRAAAEIEGIALGVLRERIGGLRRDAALPVLAAEVAVGKLDPYAAADRLLAGLDQPSVT
jgi:LAO/AO transport system kinase